MVNILIVEDNSGDFELIKLMLETNQNNYGKYDTFHAKYLSEAFDIVTGNNIDLILLDLNLPDSNGIKTLERMLRYGAIPIIVMTGLEDVALALEAIKHGAQDYITKGNVDNDRLMRSIVYALERMKNRRLLIENAIKEDRIHGLRNLIADVAHDFRTPLTIMNTAMFMYNKTKDNKHLHIIAQQISSLTTMLESFVQMSKLDNNVQTISKKEQNICNLIKELVSQYKIIAIAKRKHFFLNGCFNDEIIVNYDEHLMSRAIVNILSNAIKYTEINGNVEVRVFKGKNEVIIEVEDDGQGISEKDVQEIFNRFYRSRDNTTDEPSTGLGLSIANKIIDMHDGTLSCRSILGEGSTFEIKIPIVE